MCLCFTSFFFQDLFIHWKVKVTHKHREREKGKDDPFSGSLPKWLQCLGFGRHRALHLSFLCGWQRPSHLRHFLLLSQERYSKELVQNRAGRGSSWCPRRMPVWQVAASCAVPFCQPLVLFSYENLKDFSKNILHSSLLSSGNVKVFFPRLCFILEIMPTVPFKEQKFLIL